VADGGLTVVLSSHILADLERVCDHLVLLNSGGVQLSGPIEEIVAAHRVLTGPRTAPAGVARVHQVIRARNTERQTTLLVRANGHVYDACWQIDDVDLEEIVLAYLGLGLSAGQVPAGAAS
jgi:ABC-2 type transport system ATP-binding protein